MTEPLCVDPHVKLLDESVVRRAKRRGLDAIVYAPHFERLPAIRERADRFADDDLTVIPAREIFTGDWRNRKHVLAFDFDEPIPDFITLEATMAELDRQDAAVLVPHPTFMTVSLSAADVRTYREVIDAVETTNPKHLPWHDRRAKRLHTEIRIPAFASSYAHLHGTVGEMWTEFVGIERDEASIVEAIKTGAPRGIETRDGIVHRIRRTAEFCHLGWENSWKKFDRVVLSGMEATHPAHPAYEGRFDDASVY